MKRENILDEAKKCVCGHREQDYGSPESNFQIIADLWNDYLFPSLKENKAVISPMDVAMMMALLKIARIRNGGGTGDSFVDLAGYAACGGEIHSLENEEKEIEEKCNCDISICDKCTNQNTGYCHECGDAKRYYNPNLETLERMNNEETIDKYKFQGFHYKTKEWHSPECEKCAFQYRYYDQFPCKDCTDLDSKFENEDYTCKTCKHRFKQDNESPCDICSESIEDKWEPRETGTDK